MYINANAVMWIWCIFVSIKVKHNPYCYAWLEEDADQITFLSSHPKLNPNGYFIIWERISFSKTKIRVNSWQKWRWVSDIHDFGLHWTKYHFRSPCLLLSYYPISLEDPLCWGRFKAFSTCTSHLAVVAIFQGTMLFMYFRTSSSYSLDQDKITSLFYTLVIPMLNLLIYSLWNKDVKEALENLKNKWL